MEKSIHEQKAELLYLYVREKKNSSIKISVMILRYIRNVNLSYSKRNLELQNFLQKTFFFFTSEAVLKKAKETNTGDVESICARVTKPASRKLANAEVDVNWLWTIDYGLFWLYFYIHEQFILFYINTNVLWFHHFPIAALPPRVRRAWNLMGRSVWNELRFLLLFGKKYCFTEKFSYW